ncbi:response regulator [Paenibacillus sp. MWE-103]|uniref:Response regulator n=1 Tax=Paenibacillus artemisiicola TaxID=1172618 RepID=A0ABS3WEL4_9BACL|nr:MULTISPECIES: response regulator [Paenibacillus]MBO7746733.1 response regulator [Paenibacillus artemisiicola]SFJ76032.1 two-component system, response regulator YesN [Paenibacillus sp. UNC496MF]
MTNLLIVEDESWTRELIKQFVIQADMDIEVIGEADNGEDGLQLIREKHPDIIITDMNMPVVDGIDMLRQIETAQLDTKIIVLSGHDDFKYTRQAIRSAAVEYLLKPVDPEQLKQALKLCLEQRQRQISEALVALSPELLTVLNDYKRSVSAHLNELAVKSAEDALLECISYVDAHFNCGAPQWFRIYHEFLIMLEEFAAMECAELLDVLRDKFMKAYAPQQFAAADIAEALLGIYREAMGSIISSRKERKKLNLNLIFDYVQQHYADSISLETLAHRFFVSKEYLSKMYKLRFGENLMEQIIRLRMEAARSWVMQDGTQIKHIARRAGYEDVSYFHKLFKKHYGVSPMEMRQKEESTGGCSSYEEH